MHRKAAHLILCAALALPLSAAAQRLSPSAVLKNVEQALQRAGAMNITYKEHYLWSLTGAEQTSSGTLMLEGEEKFRAETGDQVMISDGKTLWSYNIPAARVIIDRMESNEDTMLPRRILFHYSRDYDLRIGDEEAVNGVTCLKLMFTTSTGQTMFPDVTVWVNRDTWMIVQVKQVDLNANETTYLLERVEVNQTFPRETFTFTPPEGVEVVDMRLTP
ncbi:outer membrane lipoprotein carrier protein LolA [bacterium]|nr:outer membrane lipoprotein carrier protein LolA [bacterium]